MPRPALALPRRTGVWVSVALIAALASIAAPAAAAAEVEPLAPPVEVDATGATDVTAALNAFFATVPDGTTVALPAGARYRVEGILLLDGLQGVTVEGNGATVLALTNGAAAVPPTAGSRHHWPRLRAHVWLRDARDVILRDLVVAGPNPPARYRPAYEGQAGVKVSRSVGVTLERLHVTSTFGDGLYVVGGSSRVTLRDSLIERIGRQGAALIDATGVTIERNTFRRVTRSVIDIEPAVRNTVRGVHVTGNTIGGYGNFLLAMGGAGPNVGDVWLERNTVVGGSGITAYAFAPTQIRRGLHIVDNVNTVRARAVGGEGRPAIFKLARLDDVEIRGNRQAVATPRYPVVLASNVCRLQLAANSFTGAPRPLVTSVPCRR